jgi:hypothetical protein
MKIKINAQTLIMVAAAALLTVSAVLMIQASDTLKLQIDFQEDGTYAISNNLRDETGNFKTVQQISTTDNTGKTTGSPVSVSSPTPTPVGSGWSY